MARTGRLNETGHARLGLACLAACALHAGLLTAVSNIRPAVPTPIAAPRPMAATLEFSVRPVTASVSAPSSSPPSSPPPSPPAAESVAQAPPAAASPIPATATGVPSGPTGDEFAGYLSRRELTQPAEPTGLIDFPFPEEVQGTVNLRVQVSVFVDETGAVRHVRIDTPDVHPAFEQAIRDSLQSARFTPGKVGSEAVRSRLRLEVEFSNVGR